MLKEQFLEHWTALKPNQKVKPNPVAYKHTGSTYDEDGIRLTGSAKFIDSVLSRLKELLEYESCNTRLQVVYKESTDRKTGAPLDSYNCYVQVHQRGGEAKIANALASGIAKRRVILSR